MRTDSLHGIVTSDGTVEESYFVKLHILKTAFKPKAIPIYKLALLNV
jgi:hypothetical protein